MTATAAPRAVAVGGGTGLPRVLTALLTLGCEPTAVVTMADDGGSSGRLRDDLGILPPGDIRNCLVALGADELIGGVYQYRFADGEGLAGHALGNLVIAALADITEDFIEAVRIAGLILGARGTVLPSTLEDVRLIAEDRDGNPISGQAVIANNPVPISHVELEPASPRAVPEALAAIESADLVVVGPGSLFTSILPNFLVGGVADALRSCTGRRVYVCNVANQRGETGGLDAADHVEALVAHGLHDAFDVVLVHEPTASRPDEDIELVDAGPEVRARIEESGLRVRAADLAEPGDARHHERQALARALEAVL